MGKTRKTDRLTLHVPTMEELTFRQSMMADPATMAYNAPWFPPDGCLAFPRQDWGRWYSEWVGHRPDRFYAYLRRLSDGSFVGEVDYRRPPGCDRWDMGIVICSAYRGTGYGMEGLRLLLKHAFLADGVTCLQNDFEASRTAALRIHKAVGFREIGTEKGIVHLELTREEFLAQ